jgi:ADP-ribose pyrophosphatase
MTSNERDRAERRAARLARYDELRAQRPHLFDNPSGAAYEIVFDAETQQQVADESADRLVAAGKPEEYGDIGVIYEDFFVIAIRDAVRFLDGRVGPYIRVIGAEAGTGAAVLPVLPDGRMLLIHHFRHGLRTWQWEIPRGFPGEDADGAMTAVRELEEEAGAAARKVEVLGVLSNDDGADEIYLARLDADALPDDLTAAAFAEGIDSQRLVTRGELVSMIVSGELTDGYALAAFAFATARGLL